MSKTLREVLIATKVHADSNMRSFILRIEIVCGCRHRAKCVWGTSYATQCLGRNSEKELVTLCIAELVGFVEEYKLLRWIW